MSTNKKITKKILLSIADAARNPQNRLHIVSRGDKWAVRKEGAKRAFAVYPDLDKAIEVATASVRSGKTDSAIVHDMYGEVTQKIV